MNKIFSIDLNSTDVSAGTLIAISIAGIIGAIVLFLFLKICINCERRTGKMSFSWLKIVLIGIGPALFSSKTFFDFGLDLKIGIIVTVVAVIIAFIWNMLTYGLIYGIMFTVLQTIGGLLGGISVAAIALVIVFVAVIALFGKSGGETSGDPEEIYDINTNQLYRLEKTGDSYYIYVNGEVIPVRRDDYGDWIDNDRNRFKNAH